MADLQRAFEDRRPLLDTLSQSLISVVRDVLDDLPHIDRIYGRAKSTASFLAKAAAKSDKYQEPLEDIEDQVGLRVLVFFESDIAPVLVRLRDAFVPVEDFRHEPPRDEEFGYLTHHLIFSISDHHKPEGWDDHDPIARTFEAQVRTLFMHSYAEPQHDFGYKSGDELPGQIRRQLAWIAASAWGADRAYVQVLEAINALNQEEGE